MSDTIGIKETKVEEAVTELKGLLGKLQEIDLSKGKQGGECGAVCEVIKANDMEIENAGKCLENLINETVTFLNGLKETIKAADETIGRQMEGLE